MMMGLGLRSLIATNNRCQDESWSKGDILHTGKNERQKDSSRNADQAEPIPQLSRVYIRTTCAKTIV